MGVAQKRDGEKRERRMNLESVSYMQRNDCSVHVFRSNADREWLFVSV